MSLVSVVSVAGKQSAENKLIHRNNKQDNKTCGVCRFLLLRLPLTSKYTKSIPRSVPFDVYHLLLAMPSYEIRFGGSYNNSLWFKFSWNDYIIAYKLQMGSVFDLRLLWGTISCWPDWNTCYITSVYIAIKFGTSIHDSLRMNPTDVGNPPLGASIHFMFGSIYVFTAIGWTVIKSARYVLGPQRTHPDDFPDLLTSFYTSMRGENDITISISCSFHICYMSTWCGYRRNDHGHILFTLHLVMFAELWKVQILVRTVLETFGCWNVRYYTFKF